MEQKNVEIVIVEDNPDDVRLIQEALNETTIHKDFSVFTDGESALEHLNKINPHGRCSKPGIIFLDLNLPRKSGLEILQEIKSNPSLKRIPVVVLTSSNSEDYITETYRLCANCFITKPGDHDQFLDVIKTVENFWFNIVKLPPPD